MNKKEPFTDEMIEVDPREFSKESSDEQMTQTKTEGGGVFRLKQYLNERKKQREQAAQQKNVSMTDMEIEIDGKKMPEEEIKYPGLAKKVFNHAIKGTISDIRGSKELVERLEKEAISTKSLRGLWGEKHPSSFPMWVDPTTQQLDDIAKTYLDDEIRWTGLQDDELEEQGQVTHANIMVEKKMVLTGPATENPLLTDEQISHIKILLDEHNCKQLDDFLNACPHSAMSFSSTATEKQLLDMIYGMAIMDATTAKMLIDAGIEVHCRAHEKRLNNVRQLLKLQSQDGTWNYDSYNHGLTNGIILALSTMMDVEPPFYGAPEKWGDGSLNVEKVIDSRPMLSFPWDEELLKILGYSDNALDNLVEALGERGFSYPEGNQLTRRGMAMRWMLHLYDEYGPGKWKMAMQCHLATEKFDNELFELSKSWHPTITESNTVINPDTKYLITYDNKELLSILSMEDRVVISIAENMENAGYDVMGNINKKRGIVMQYLLRMFSKYGPQYLQYVWEEIGGCKNECQTMSEM